MKAKNRKRFRMLGKILFVLYIAFLLYFLIFSDWYGRGRVMDDYRYNLVLFAEIRRFWTYRDMLGWVSFANLFGNVLIFMPFGFFMPMASKYRSFFLTTVYSFALSMLVEVFQLVSKVGSFDVDDLLLNTIGGIVGYVSFVICNAIRRWHDENRAGKGSRTRAGKRS
ncbi:VanZ family protein [Roseburia hominis]